jgi:hypothetical protein
MFRAHVLETCTEQYDVSAELKKQRYKSNFMSNIIITKPRTPLICLPVQISAFVKQTLT